MSLSHTTAPSSGGLRCVVDEPGLEMVLLTPTTFMMGATDAELRRFRVPARYARREFPTRQVPIRVPFMVASTPVTRGQFRRFVSEGGQAPARFCEVFRSGRWVFDESLSWEDPGFSQRDDHPVVAISWHDAKRYLAWLSERNGRIYRLLSDAEFEYAARGGTSTPWFWGERVELQGRYAKGADLSALGDPDTFSLSQTYGSEIELAQCRTGFAYTAPVASFRPNPVGLFDMLGNVWEWVEDDFDECILPGGQAPVRLDGSPFRTIRGGSWAMEPVHLRCASRQRDYAWHNDRDIGFRVARDLTPNEHLSWIDINAREGRQT